MGIIKESDDVDFYVDNKPLTADDKKMISEVIAHYKATGKKKRLVQHRHGAIQSGARKAKSKIHV